MPIQFSGPKTSDGKQIVLPNLFPGNVYLYIHGAGDSANARGDGQAFNASRDTAGTTTTEWTILDWVYVAGGGILWEGAVLGDWVSLESYAPATPVTPNGNNTGNCNLVDPGVGASILVVPAAGDGAYDVDLDDAVPVPADTDENGIGTGYFDWSAPGTGKGTVSVSSTPGSALFHLFASDIPLARFVNRLPMLGTGFLDITVAAVKPKKMLPHWKYKVSIHNEGGNHTLKTAWYVTVARTRTL